MNPIKIPPINFIRVVLKPKLASKLGFKKLFKVTFKADKGKDLIVLSGIGVPIKHDGRLSGNIRLPFYEIKAEPLKLSENPEYENIALKQIYKHIPKSDFKELYGLQSTLDFETGNWKGEVLYYAKDGSKHFREFLTTF